MKYTRLLSFTVLAAVLSLPGFAQTPPPPPITNLKADNKTINPADAERAALQGTIDTQTKAIAELNGQLSNLQQAYQNLTSQRDALAKQFLDTQLQTQLLAQQMQAAQEKFKTELEVSKLPPPMSPSPAAVKR